MTGRQQQQLQMERPQIHTMNKNFLLPTCMGVLEFRLEASPLETCIICVCVAKAKVKLLTVKPGTIL